MALTDPTGQPGPMQPGEFLSASVPNLVSFKVKNVDPPSSLYIQRDDVLVINHISTGAGNTVTATARLWLAAEGRISTIQAQQTTLAFTQQQMTIPLAEGYLLSVYFQGASNAIGGSSFAIGFLNRGIVATPPSAGAEILFMGNCNNVDGIYWPGASRQMPGDGNGVPVSQAVANPAAGADWSFTVPINSMVEMVSFVATLTTSATAGNRNVQLQIDDGVSAIFFAPPTASIGASLAAIVCGSQLNVTSVVVPLVVSIPIASRNWLQGGFHLKTVTANLQAGDQWSGIRLFFRQWVTF